MEEGEHWFTSENSDINDEEDMSQLCRICANSSEYLIPIFQGEGLEHQLKSKIAKHLPIKVLESDRLPNNACYQCASTLIAWHDLVVSSLEAEEKLKSLLSGHCDLDRCKDAVPPRQLLGGNMPVKRNIVQTNKVLQTDDTIIGEEELVANQQIDLMLGSETITAEEVASLKSDLKEAASEPRHVADKNEEISNGVKNEIETITIKNEMCEVLPSEMMEQSLDDNMMGLGTVVYEDVETYQDVETSVIVQEFVEGLEEGQYYLISDNDEFVQSSVEVSNQDLSDASEMEDFQSYICHECGKIFTQKAAFKIHRNSHHLNKGHFCDYCDVNYKRIDHLEKHIEIMHPRANITLAPREKKVNPYAKTFLCNTCGKILKSNVAYENHTLKHQSKNPYQCTLCSEKFPNRGVRRRHEVKEHNLLTKENGNPDGYHVCDICGLELFSDGAYYHHKDKHGQPYKCTFCHKIFGSRSLMQVHARRHTTERPFVCSVCNRDFKVKQELNAHMNIHRDLRPYPCPHCPKMCRKSSDLIHHIRTHTGEKPFICDKCGRGFAQAGDMRKHRQLHFRPSKINKNLSS